MTNDLQTLAKDHQQNPRKNVVGLETFSLLLTKKYQLMIVEITYKNSWEIGDILLLPPSTRRRLLW